MCYFIATMCMIFGLWCFVFLECVCCTKECGRGVGVQGGFGNHHTADVWSSCLIVLCVPFREMDLCTFDGIESFSVDKALQWV